MEQTNIVSFSGKPCAVVMGRTPCISFKLALFRAGLLKLAQFQQIDSEAFIESVRDEYYQGGELETTGKSPSKTRPSSTTVRFYDGGADELRCASSCRLSCRTDAERLRSVRSCLSHMFPSEILTTLVGEEYAKFHTELQQPCFLFFNVVSACRGSAQAPNAVRQWRRAPRPLALRSWSQKAGRSPAHALTLNSTRIPTCPMYSQYEALLLQDYWCIGKESNEWTQLLRNSPLLLRSGSRTLTGEQGTLLLFAMLSSHCGQ